MFYFFFLNWILSWMHHWPLVIGWQISIGSHSTAYILFEFKDVNRPFAFLHMLPTTFFVENLLWDEKLQTEYIRSKLKFMKKMIEVWVSYYEFNYFDFHYWHLFWKLNLWPQYCIRFQSNVMRKTIFNYFQIKIFSALF